ADGRVVGSFRYDYAESGHATTYRGRVTCLSVSAERAWIGGYVTKTDDPSARGAWVWWQVDDGTQLGLSDQTTFVGFGTRAPTFGALLMTSLALSATAPVAHAAASTASSRPPGYHIVNSGPIPVPPGNFDAGVQVTCPAGTVPWGGGVGFTGGIASPGENINT